MTSTLEPSVFFANLKPDLEQRKELIENLKLILSKSKLPMTVYVSGPGNSGKTALITIVQKITGMVSVPLCPVETWPKSDFFWLRDTSNSGRYDHSLNFESDDVFKSPKVFIVCDDEFPITDGKQQISIVLDRIFPALSHGGWYVDLSKYKDYEEYIKNY